MKKRTGVILTILSSFAFLAFSPVSILSASLDTDGTIPNEVVIGSEITADMIDIEHNGITKKATSCIIITPTGGKIVSNKIVFSEAGKYTFDFSAEFDGEKITKGISTISIRTPESMFSSYNASFSRGTFAYNDKLDSSLGATEYEGLKVSSRDGGTITFNKILDLNKATKDDSLIDFIVEPSTLGSYDIGEMLITLTDADDPNNKVDIRYVDGLAGSGNQMRLTYATARANNQYYAGYENWNGYWHINSDQIGSPTFLSLRGLDDQIIASFGTGYLNSRLFFDYSSRQILVESEYSVVGSKVLINDLDSTNIYATNPWLGFKNGRAILSITTKDVSGTNGTYIIKSIQDYDFSNELLKDNESPKISIDFAGNDKDNLPLAKQGSYYPVFKADIFDNFDDDLYINKKVQYFDKNKNAYISVNNDGNRFLTNYYGEYLVSYYCKDRTGNEIEDSYRINCSSLVKKIDIVIPNYSSTYHAYDKINLCPLSDVSILNAQGIVTLKRYLISPDGEETELMNNSFTPTDLGLYRVKYVASDIYEEPVIKIVDYQIENLLHPLIVEEINMPSIMIKGQYYDIPSIECKYPDENQIATGKVDVYVNNNIFTEDKLYVQSLEDVVIDFVPESSWENKKSFTIKIREGMDDNGRIIKSNYFFSSDLNYTTAEIINKSLEFTANSEAKISFAKSIASDELSLSFGLDEETINNYNGFEIVIQDKNDSDKNVTLKIIPSSNKLKLLTPYEAVAKELECDENKQFELYYRPFNHFLRDANYKDICRINYYDNGEKFAGFSEEIYLSFGFSGLTNPSKFSLLFINNQSFKTSIVKDNAGPQIITDSSLNWANELGTEVTISKASAYDVLSYVEYVNVTMTDSQGTKLLDNDDASVDHKITLSKYGNYRIEYQSKDGNRRTSSRSFTICCIENEKPQININLTVKDQYAINEIFTLPSYSFTDNSLNCSLEISLYLPNGQAVAIEHADMIDGEILKENYLNLDHYSSQLVNNSNSIKLYMVGKYTLRYLVIDAYGNVNYKEFILNVR